LDHLPRSELYPIYTVTLGFYLGTALAFVAWWNWALFALLVVAYALTLPGG